MSTEIDAAMIGLLGVGVGAVVSLVGTVVVPWIRDSIDQRRDARERIENERREMLLSAMDALMQMRQAAPGSSERGSAQARFGAARNRLVVRLTAGEQPVLDVLIAMLVLVQEPRHPNVTDMIGESMEVLTLWARGEVRTGDIIAQVEDRAQIDFSEDRKTFAARTRAAS